MPRMMANCPSPLALRTIDTPDTRCNTFPTVMSGSSEMALAPMIFRTLSAFCSVLRVLLSLSRSAEAVTVTSNRSVPSPTNTTSWVMLPAMTMVLFRVL